MADYTIPCHIEVLFLANLLQRKFVTKKSEIFKKKRTRNERRTRGRNKRVSFWGRLLQEREESQHKKKKAVIFERERTARRAKKILLALKSGRKEKQKLRKFFKRKISEIKHEVSIIICFKLFNLHFHVACGLFLLR